MPDFPIVDSHLHIWDTGRLRYPWLADLPKINPPHGVADLHAAAGPVTVDKAVFVQAEVDPPQAYDEAAWVAEQAAAHGTIAGIVAWAPLENGDAVRADLDRLKQLDLLRGIRRIIQFEPDLEFCLQPGFIEGVRTLADYGLTFDICIDRRHMANTIAFARQCETVPMVLDHIGKPDIAGGEIEPWRSQMKELAAMDHVVCKISGVATEADHDDWTRDQLRPYIDAAADAFGIDRLMFGGDWPVAKLAIDYPEWVETVDWAFAGASEDETRKLFRDTAIAFYRLD